MAEPLKCPICQAVVTARRPSQSPSFPFCSPRCKLIDLGRWLDGQYSLPSRPATPEEIDEGQRQLPPSGDRSPRLRPLGED